jgi:hypothetical protein
MSRRTGESGGRSTNNLTDDEGVNMADAIEGGISGAIEEILGNVLTGSLGEENAG